MNGNRASCAKRKAAQCRRWAEDRREVGDFQGFRRWMSEANKYEDIVTRASAAPATDEASMLKWAAGIAKRRKP